MYVFTAIRVYTKYPITLMLVQIFNYLQHCYKKAVNWTYITQGIFLNCIPPLI